MLRLSYRSIIEVSLSLSSYHKKISISLAVFFFFCYLLRVCFILLYFGYTSEKATWGKFNYLGKYLIGFLMKKNVCDWESYTQINLNKREKKHFLIKQSRKRERKQKKKRPSKREPKTWFEYSKVASKHNWSIRFLFTLLRSQIIFGCLVDGFRSVKQQKSYKKGK